MSAIGRHPLATGQGTTPTNGGRLLRPRTARPAARGRAVLGHDWQRLWVRFFHPLRLSIRTDAQAALTSGTRALARSEAGEIASARALAQAAPTLVRARVAHDRHHLAIVGASSRAEPPSPQPAVGAAPRRWTWSGRRRHRARPSQSRSVRTPASRPQTLPGARARCFPACARLRAVACRPTARGGPRAIRPRRPMNSRLAKHSLAAQFPAPSPSRGREARGRHAQQSLLTWPASTVGARRVADEVGDRSLPRGRRSRLRTAFWLPRPWRLSRGGHPPRSRGRLSTVRPAQHRLGRFRRKPPAHAMRARGRLPCRTAFAFGTRRTLHRRAPRRARTLVHALTATIHMSVLARRTVVGVCVCAPAWLKPRARRWIRCTRSAVRCSGPIRAAACPSTVFLAC